MSNNKKLKIKGGDVPIYDSITKILDNKNDVIENTYTIIDFPEDGKQYGEFKAKFPKIAANNALTELFKYIDDSEDFENKFLVFVIKNIQTEKLYKYIGTRIKLENVVQNKYQYKNVVGKYRKELDKL